MGGPGGLGGQPLQERDAFIDGGHAERALTDCSDAVEVFVKERPGEASL